MNSKRLLSFLSFFLFAGSVAIAQPADRDAPKRPQQDRAQQQRPQMQQLRAQQQQRMQQQQRGQQQQRMGANMMSMRILMMPPEVFERVGVSSEVMEQLKEQRNGLRGEFGPLMKTMRDTDEAFRNAMREADATEKDLMAKLEATAAAQLALRKKDLEVTMQLRELIGLETIGKIMRERNPAMAGAMRDRMTDRARPDAAGGAPNPKAPWLNDQGDRIKKPVRPKRPAIEE